MGERRAVVVMVMERRGDVDLDPKDSNRERQNSTGTRLLVVWHREARESMVDDARRFETRGRKIRAMRL